MSEERNWAGNYKYGASNVCYPESVEEVQEIVARASRVKALGTRHSFNSVADTDGCLISLAKFNRVIALDRANSRVTVEGGIRYGELAQFLHQHGCALHNMASLPHISVAGACATATHGSGDGNGNLATAVQALEIVKADGEVVTLRRDEHDDFAGAVVGLGALGVVTRLTLNVVPSYQVSQTVYENLPLAALDEHFDRIFSSGYSVSLFTDWTEAVFNQVWVKRRVDADGSSDQTGSEFYGARPARAPMHPVAGMPPEHCSEQFGVPGAWHERLPHFRLEFMPSAGKELQSEYFVKRRDAYAALCAIERIKTHIAPHLHISEIRTIAADDLWMSPSCQQDSAGIHFTWKADEKAVGKVLPLIEQQLEPFRARPHWGKLFAMTPAQVQPLFERLPDFRRLIGKCDPHGKFRNAFLEQYIYG